MTRRPRRNHSPAFKAKVALAAMKGETQHQAELINKDVAFLSLDFLAAVVTRRVNRGPPFSALFTLWLSMMAALGLSARPACARHC
jgi:hypothetical protein